MYLLKRKSKLSFACLGSNIIPIIGLEFFCKEVFNFKFMFDNHNCVYWQKCWHAILLKTQPHWNTLYFWISLLFYLPVYSFEWYSNYSMLLFSCFPNPSLDDSVVGDRKSEGLSWKGLHARLWTLEYLSRWKITLTDFYG